MLQRFRIRRPQPDAAADEQRLYRRRQTNRAALYRMNAIGLARTAQTAFDRGAYCTAADLRRDAAMYRAEADQIDAELRRLP